ncbi:iron-sulfur cluster assembly scaffold protein [Desulfosporosinus sp. Sb-LF]|uniref:iron-sulfur cluster assembly scaffold protein n=1 Tax=Desulfosporosinus sp. Sb-LF TaxID=2560027 RepID=UPI00107F5722|nr:iron-sulfur cluster assembly scaffold protein [Desulfosporosinus sp. Sb-LF]TGE32102.1 iron-sulfur cluster assembly scaffold protein [Desulfosporosinus sp. Sb-LF]
MYSEKVVEHFDCPQNVGSMPDADGVGTVEDLNNGGALTIYVKVQFRIITEISFLAVGCTASVAATGSVINVLAKGKSIDEAMKISVQDVINSLKGLPEDKQYCSNLGVAVLRKAIGNYSEKRGIYSSQIDHNITSKPSLKVRAHRQKIV